ncbi:hypothetical protein BZG36_02883 [Bifiguratus adelaidae]|uniref:N-acetyltransferase domain-containing protein n=1 Tax=Bifiguratus adelaidae TaxID=1938954 RepID=A0A261Y250_9FUNG|nr:hypothetical protein BZG36_02883 [Bifiguratus adelaidae]
MALHRPTLPWMGSLAAFATAAAIQLYHLRRRISSKYVDYAESCLVDDLADIATHYRLVGKDGHYSPASAAHFLVAVDIDRVIGCLALDLTDPFLAFIYAKDIPIPIPHAFTAYLKRMSLHPDYQSRGIASQLICAMMDHAKGAASAISSSLPQSFKTLP